MDTMMGAIAAGSGTVRVEKDGGAAVVAVAGRGPDNLVSRAVMEALAGALEALDRDPAAGCVVLTGTPRAFCGGLDASELAETAVVDPGRDAYFACWDRVGAVSKPVVAAVSGAARGAGFELALACDLIIASETAAFSMDHLALGVIPGAGGTQRLVRALGRQRAMELLLTGRSMPAREALERGLVSRVYPGESYLIQARALALELAAKPPLAVRALKRAVRKAGDLDLAAGLECERGLCASLFSTADQKEGMKALRDGREPRFEGR